MKKAVIAGGPVATGIGLTTIGLSNSNRGPQACAVMPTAMVEAGTEEPTIVWWSVQPVTRAILVNGAVGGPGAKNETHLHLLYLGWSDGTLERRAIETQASEISCGEIHACNSDWFVISSRTEGLNAAPDNFDEVVNGADLASLPARWGDAPRNSMPPGDHPLGLLYH